MARPESQAIAGYFPTPDHLVPAIASLVALERERYDRPVFFDPCAGTGSALVALAAAVLDLAPGEAARYCQAIELEATGIKVNAVTPGYTKTALNNHLGTETVEEGAAEAVRVALLGPDSPSGTFTHATLGVIPW